MECPIENDIRAQGLTAPRVTPADIELTVRSEHYFKASDGAYGAELFAGALTSVVPPALGLLTFCVLVLKNGFTVVGQSACASPENFNEQIGRKIARQDALEKVWPLLGYELRTKLSQESAK